MGRRVEGIKNRTFLAQIQLVNEARIPNTLPCFSSRARDKIVAINLKKCDASRPFVCLTKQHVFYVQERTGGTMKKLIEMLFFSTILGLLTHETLDAQLVCNNNDYDLMYATTTYKEKGGTNKNISFEYYYDVSVTGWKRIPAKSCEKLDRETDGSIGELVFVAIESDGKKSAKVIAPLPISELQSRGRISRETANNLKGGIYKGQKKIKEFGCVVPSKPWDGNFNYALWKRKLMYSEPEKLINPKIDWKANNGARTYPFVEIKNFPFRRIKETNIYEVYGPRLKNALRSEWVAVIKNSTGRSIAYTVDGSDKAKVLKDGYSRAFRSGLPKKFRIKFDGSTGSNYQERVVDLDSFKITSSVVQKDIEGFDLYRAEGRRYEFKKSGNLIKVVNDVSERPTAKKSNEMLYEVRRKSDGKIFGPVPLSKVKSWLRENKISDDDKVRVYFSEPDEGEVAFGSTWVPASEYRSK